MDNQGYYPMTNPPAAPSYIRPAKAEDWEPYRQIIADLYATKKLKEVMEEMETVYYFKATPRQYKGKIKQWGLDTKYTKTEEYMEILKTKKQLEKGESSSGQTKFTIRGKPVSESSISRFERRAKKRGIIPKDDDADADADYHQQQHSHHHHHHHSDHSQQPLEYQTTDYQGYDVGESSGYPAAYPTYSTTDYQTGYEDTSHASGSGTWSGY